jgi:phospholipase/carboxylesterase
MTPSSSSDRKKPRLVSQGSVLEMTGLVHRVREPDGPGPHPTVVMLHGRSGDEEVMWVFARTLPKDWLVVAPRGIKPDPDGGYAWHPRQRDEWPSLATFETAAQAVSRFIRSLPGVYHADPERIFVMGFSQGAATAYATAMYEPGLIRGIAGLVGFVPVSCEAAIDTLALQNLPIFMAVGKEDPLIPYERTASCAQTLRASGADLTYHEYDTGHRLNAQGMRDLAEWWQAQAAAVDVPENGRSR